MRLLLALFLTGCATVQPNCTVFQTGEVKDDCITAADKRTTSLDQYGLTRVKYRYGMSLVPCLSTHDTGSRPLTTEQRLQYKAQYGGYLANCQGRNDVYVWG